MNHQDAMIHATTIARLLYTEACGMISTPTRNLTKYGRYSIERAKAARDGEALNPRIDEIIIFGSILDTETEVTEINMFAIDHGFYSGTLLNKALTETMPEDIHGNLMRMLKLWFFNQNKVYAKSDIEIVLSTQVNLTVLPVRFLTNSGLREMILSNQLDPAFCRRAFRRMMRFDPDSGRFVAISLEYLERRFGADLSRLAETIDTE